MPLGEPPALARGTDGEVRIPGGPRLGTLTQWRVVLSPTTGKHTLIAEGRFSRHYVSSGLQRAQVEVRPAPLPKRIGRPTPRTPTPFRFTGRVALLTSRQLTLAEGETSPL